MLAEATATTKTNAAIAAAFMVFYLLCVKNNFLKAVSIREEQ